MTEFAFASKLDLREKKQKEETNMDVYKLHIGCVDPLAKAIQSMKDALEEMRDECLVDAVKECIVGIGEVQANLLEKAGEALKQEISTIRQSEDPVKGEPLVAQPTDIASQIAGRAPLQQAAEKE